MADLKDLFTYPNDSSTNHFDPTYYAGVVSATDIISGMELEIKTVGTTDFTTIGASANTVGTTFTSTGTVTGTGEAYLTTSGIVNKIKKLKDGDYKSWPNLSPTGTYANIIQNISKFKNYFDFYKHTDSISVFDFYKTPLVKANKTLIAANATISAGDTANPATITTSASHEFLDGQLVNITGMDGSWGLLYSGSTDYYVQNKTSTTLQLSTDAGGTNLLGFGASGVVGAKLEFRENAITRIYFTNNDQDYVDGQEIEITSITGNGQELLNDTFYIKEDTSYTLTPKRFLLYEDSGLTNGSTFTEAQPFDEVEVSLTVVDNFTSTTHMFVNGSFGNFSGTKKIWFSGNVTGVGGTTYMSTGNKDYYIEQQSNLTDYRIYDGDGTNPIASSQTATRTSIRPFIPTNSLDSDPFRVSLGNTNGSYSEVYSDTDKLAGIITNVQYNGQDIDDTGIHFKDLGNDNFELYYDSAYTNPVDRASLDETAFTTTNAITLEGNLLFAKATSSSLNQYNRYSFTQAGVENFIGTNSKIYTETADRELHSNDTQTTRYDSIAFDADDIQLMPSDNQSAAIQVDLSSLTVTPSRIQIQTVSGNGGALEGNSYYTKDVGSGNFELYNDSSYTSSVTADSLVFSQANGDTALTGVEVIHNTNPARIKVTGTTLTGDTLRLNNQGAVTSWQNSTSMFANDEFLFLSAHSNPNEYEIYTDSGKSTAKSFVATETYNLESAPSSYPSTQAVITAGTTYEPSTDITDYILGPSNFPTTIQNGFPLTVGSFTGNGDDLAGTVLYVKNNKFYKNVDMTQPLQFSDINDEDSAFKTFTFEPATGNDRVSTGAHPNRTFYPSTKITAVSDGSNIAIADGNIKLKYTNEDVTDTDNKLFEQSGFLADGDIFYNDLSGGSSSCFSNIFNGFGYDNSTGQNLSTANTAIKLFPELVIDPVVDTLDYSKYSNYPYDHSGELIADIYDDSNTVKLNDPTGAASTFGLFKINNSYNSFHATLNTGDQIRLGPDSKFEATQYFKDGERLFQEVNNSGVKQSINLSSYATDTDFTVNGTTQLPLMSGGTEVISTASPFGYHYITTTDANLTKRTPFYFWDASDNYYVGFWTGDIEIQNQYAPVVEKTNAKVMVFWTKANWEAGLRSVKESDNIASTLTTAFVEAEAPATRSTGTTFNFADAFTFNNITGLESGTSGSFLGSMIDSVDYSIEGNEPDDNIRNGGGLEIEDVYTSTSWPNSLNDLHVTAYTIVVPRFNRHKLNTASHIQYISLSNPAKLHFVMYNNSYNASDTTENQYWGYFNHGDTFTIPGKKSGTTATYMMFKRGTNTKLKYRYATVSNATESDIVTVDMEGEVWSLIGLNDRPMNPSYAYWNNPENDAYWLSSAIGAAFDTSTPFNSMRMFDYSQTGNVYNPTVTLLSGNMASGTGVSATELDYQERETTYSHPNKNKLKLFTPFDVTLPITAPIMNSTEPEFYTMDSGTANVKRYTNTGETVTVYPYDFGNLTFTHPDRITTANRTVDVAVIDDVDAEATFSFTPVAATQGTVALSPNQPFPYKVNSLEIVLPGNQVYSHLDASGSSTFGARAKDRHFDEGGTTFTAIGSQTAADITVNLNGSGYLNSVTLNDGGRYSNGDAHAVDIDSKADLFTARTSTTAELEDVFDTQDHWGSAGFEGGQKEWPVHVMPKTAQITYTQPSVTNLTQSGRKFVRSSNITKWQLEVEYPPMSKTDFEEFRRVALAVKGQAIPFYFRLQYPVDGGNKNILWSNPEISNSTTVPTVIDINADKDILTMGGFDSDEAKAFRAGEVIIGASRNGNLSTVINEVESNKYGEAKIRLTHPVTGANFGDNFYKRPYHAIVTLADDNFEYGVDEMEYYYFSVKFDLDEFK